MFLFLNNLAPFFFCLLGIGGILNDEMGLGKTCQVLHAISRLKRHFDTGKFIILVEKRIMTVWADEIEKFICEDDRTWFHIDGDRPGCQFVRKYLENFVFFFDSGFDKPTGMNKRDLLQNGDSYVLILSNHSFDMHLHHLKDVHFQCVMLEEGHRASNPESALYNKISRGLKTESTIMTISHNVKNG